MDDVLKNVSHDSLLYKEESTKVLTFVILFEQHISEVRRNVLVKRHTIRQKRVCMPERQPLMNQAVNVKRNQLCLEIDLQFSNT